MTNLFGNPSAIGRLLFFGFCLEFAIWIQIAGRDFSFGESHPVTLMADLLSSIGPPATVAVGTLVAAALGIVADALAGYRLTANANDPSAVLFVNQARDSVGAIRAAIKSLDATLATVDIGSEKHVELTAARPILVEAYDRGANRWVTAWALIPVALSAIVRGVIDYPENYFAWVSWIATPAIIASGVLVLDAEFRNRRVIRAINDGSIPSG